MKTRHLSFVAALLALAASLAALGNHCLVPDVGGTAAFPPNCPSGYQGPMHMTNGLPPGSQLMVSARLANFNVFFNGPGGSLGGQVQHSQAMMQLDMTGTGALAGYARTLMIPMQCETHTGPAQPGQPWQTYPSDLFRLQGQLPPGDPDFDLLRINAGNAFGMPSPGHTTLLWQSGAWNVDSFFDIEYRIEFIGAPGSPLFGSAGITNDDTYLTTEPPTPMIDAWSTDGGCAGNTQALPPINSPPIPPDFFGPGSDPFQGIVCYQGEPLGSTPYGDFEAADTIIRRPLGDPFDRVALPGYEIDIPIEIVALNLKSVQPITVTYNGGAIQEQWSVQMNLSVVPAPMGSMTAAKMHANGGTWDATLPVQAKFTFTRIDQPSDTRVLDTGVEGLPPDILSVDSVPWVHDVDPIIPLEGGCCTDFHPGIQDPNQSNDFVGGQTLVSAVLVAPGAMHTIRRAVLQSPCPADIAPPGGNGSVGVPDLLALINSWGLCAGCPADLVANGSVGVPDLLALINSWGLCPLP